MRLMLTFLLLLAPVAASAATTSERERFLAAGQTFQALAAKAAKRGDMPRLSDPKARETLEILSNESGTFGTDAFPVGDDVSALMEVCETANNVSNAYRGFRFKERVQERLDKGLIPPNPDKKTIDALVTELLGSSAIHYQDEVFPLVDFIERCEAAEQPLMADFFEKLPPEQRKEIRLEGLRKMRVAFAQGVVAAVKGLDCAEVSQDNRRRRLDAEARDLPAFVATMPLAERAALRDELQGLRASAPAAYRATIDGMLESLADSRCEGLCRF